ncbi:MAG: VanZ family protein [Dissulfuribacterales bacterium]
MDKIVHFLAYFWLASLPFLGFDRMRHAAIAALLMIVLGIGLELAQAFVPGRQLSSMDMLANSTGVGAGIFLFRNRYKEGFIRYNDG